MFIAGGRTDIKLLLLGETGSGKSTWINGLANCVSFQTLNEAEKAHGSFPIRATFRVINPETYKEQLIATDKSVGQDDDAAGESVTQEPRTYSFKHGEKTINVIDTPGLSDTTDASSDTHETDKQHVDNILHFIGRFDKLHAICILLKPNQSRITKGFAYCITEILHNLHESASNNVIFIISNAKSTDFTPGYTLPTLKSFRHENSLDRIRLDRDTIYCIENDTMQHIAEHVDGMKLDKNAHEAAEESWKRSARTTNDMLTYIQRLEPHDIAGTLGIRNT